MALVNANMNFRISYYMRTYVLQTVFKNDLSENKNGCKYNFTI